jgi:hypothetical protein
VANYFKGRQCFAVLGKRDYCFAATPIRCRLGRVGEPHRLLEWYVNHRWGYYTHCRLESGRHSVGNTWHNYALRLLKITSSFRKVDKKMSDDKESDRARRKKRRGQKSREKDVMHAERARTANLESKVSEEKVKLDQRIRKLIEQGYSIESVAKRLGVTVRRINVALGRSA